MIDQYGLYVEENGDGGDCPHRTGLVLAYAGFASGVALLSAQKAVAAVQTVLQVAPNVYERYPVVYNQPSDFSRDQASRLMLGLGVSGHKEMTSAYYKQVFKNGLKHPNGDYIGTGEPGNIIRILNMWYLYPLLILLDIKFLGDLIARKYNPWGYDALFLPDLLLANKKYPTPFGFLTRILVRFTNAESQIFANLLAPGANGCKQAGEALEAMFTILKFQKPSIVNITE